MPGIKIITYRPRISNPPLPRMFGPPRPPPRKPRLGGPSIFDGLVPNRNSIKRYKITHNEVKNRDLTKRNKYNLLKLMKGAKQHCPAPASNPQERQNLIQSNKMADWRKNDSVDGFPGTGSKLYNTNWSQKIISGYWPHTFEILPLDILNLNDLDLVSWTI